MVGKKEEIQTPKKQISYFHAYCICLQKVASLFREKKSILYFLQRNKITSKEEDKKY